MAARWSNCNTWGGASRQYTSGDGIDAENPRVAPSGAWIVYPGLAKRVRVVVGASHPDKPLFPRKPTAKMLRGDLIAAGLPTTDLDGDRLVFHSFRRTAATWHDELGTDASVIQALGLWKTRGMVEHYQKTRRHRVAAAVERMPDLGPNRVQVDSAENRTAWCRTRAA